MAQFAKTYAPTIDNALVVVHVVGATPASQVLRFTLARICQEIQEAIPELAQIPVPADIEELQGTLKTLLTAAGEHKRIVIIIDAVNQMVTHTPLLSHLTHLSAKHRSSVENALAAQPTATQHTYHDQYAP